MPCNIKQFQYIDISEVVHYLLLLTFLGKGIDVEGCLCYVLEISFIEWYLYVVILQFVH